jgi:hypothetical protein
MKLTALAVFRNEAPYLGEWIAFHLLQGVERFLLYQNCITDDWESALAPFDDVVDVVDFSRQAPCQFEAYAAGLNLLRGRSRWVAVLDIDEFLFTVDGTSLPQLLSEFDDAPALVVNWMIFGYGGHELRPSGLTIEQYLKRPPADHPPNKHVKSIVRPEAVKEVLTPHHFAVQGTPVDELHRPVLGP